MEGRFINLAAIFNFQLPVTFSTERFVNQIVLWQSLAGKLSRLNKRPRVLSTWSLSAMMLNLQMLSAGVSDSVKRDGLGSSGVETCHNGERLVFFRSKLKQLASWWDKVFTSKQECVTFHINKCKTQKYSRNSNWTLVRFSKMSKRQVDSSV